MTMGILPNRLVDIICSCVCTLIRGPKMAAATLRFGHSPGLLVVTQTPAVQEEVRNLLNDARRDAQTVVRARPVAGRSRPQPAVPRSDRPGHLVGHLRSQTKSFTPSGERWWKRCGQSLIHLVRLQRQKTCADNTSLLQILHSRIEAGRRRRRAAKLVSSAIVKIRPQTPEKYHPHPPEFDRQGMLSPDQLLRVAIVGTSCSGKSTLARSLASSLHARTCRVGRVTLGAQLDSLSDRATPRRCRSGDGRTPLGLRRQL